ncbi:MAG: type-F conjugative transfer system pilin assembly protein TrbC, partial [Planctomycetota bacterium]|nr:type-F conjugative transfer system pilin assembly protein TrbC [Planctomycetota bacterium]
AGAQYQEEARSLAATNQQSIARGMTMLRDDPTFGDAARAMMAPVETDGALYVAVSLSMPKESLRQLATDAHRAGAKVVVRGLVNGSFEQTLVAAKEVFGEDAVSGVAIEPQVFRAYGIERVPAFIAATAPVEPCDQGIDCTSAATPHDRLAGNITLAEALRIIAERGVQAPDVARAALERLEG